MLQTPIERSTTKGPQFGNRRQQCSSFERDQQRPLCESALPKIDSLFTMEGKRTKIFGIGLNKSGTTSLDEFFGLANLTRGTVRLGERAWDSFVSNGNPRPLARYLRSASAFQDVPFSLPGWFRKIHALEPEAKFVLTTRVSTDVWVDSITNFHSRLFSSDPKRPPTWDDLRNASYVRPGWIRDLMLLGLGADSSEPYDPIRLRRIYEIHNNSVRAFFLGNPNFCEVEVGSGNEVVALGKVFPELAHIPEFPHLNATTNLRP